MKKISLFFLVLCCFGCKNKIEIISSIKQTVIPGVKTVKSYTNYVFKVDVNTNEIISIDSLLVYQNKQLLYPKFLIKKEGASKYTDKIKASGVYLIEAAIKEGNFLNATKIIEDEINKVVMFYTFKDKKSKMEINSFEEKKKRRR